MIAAGGAKGSLLGVVVGDLGVSSSRSLYKVCIYINFISVDVTSCVVILQEAEDL